MEARPNLIEGLRKLPEATMGSSGFRDVFSNV
jgi:hypothetical protein